MIKQLCILLSLLTVMALSGAEAAKVRAEDILFLAHFNGTVKPEIGNAEGMAITAESTSGKAGFAFADSIPQAEALNVSLSNAYAAYPAKDNIDIDEGTLQLLVKPQWKPDSYGHCIFFKLLFDSPDHSGCFTGTNSFYLQKSPKKETIALIQNGNIAGIYADIPKDGRDWLQLTATWSITAGKMHLYINGEHVGERAYYAMTRQPSEIMFGHPKTWNAQALLDEARILSRPLSAAEVKQDYEYLMSLHEFTGASLQDLQPMSFEPIPVAEAETGLVATLLPIDFLCQRTTEKIQLDGNLQEEAWKNAEVISALETPRKSAQLPPPTEIRLVYDDEAFYISAVMKHLDMSTHIAQFDQNDLAIYNDECLEFFLDITNRNDDFYQFCINSLGSIYDAKGGKKIWNAIGAKAVGTRQPDGWTVEVRIPFAAFGRPTPLPGEIWGARLCREHHHGTAAVSIPVRSQQLAFHQRHSLGRLIFTHGKTETSSESVTHTFGLGVNHIDVKTIGNWPEKGTLTIISMNDDSVHLKEEKRELSFGKAMTVPVTIESDAVATIALQFNAPNGKLLGCTVLKRDFLFAAPGLTAMADELGDVSAFLEPLRRIKHPVYMGACASVQRMDDCLQEFQGKLKVAIATGKQLDKEYVNNCQALLNGFMAFCRENMFLVWETSPWENGTPKALPPMNYRPLKQLTFEQASNEREAKTFIVSGLFTGSRLDARIAVHAIKGSDNTFIPESHFEIYTEPFINYLGSKLTSPLVEVPGNLITLTPGEAIRIRVTVNSRGIAPGDYRTQLIIKPLNDFNLPNKTISLNLKVWNFTLPETCDWPIDCFLWGPNTFQNDEVAMLELMHSRHINYGWTKSYIYTTGIQADRKASLPKDVPFRLDETQTANQEFFETAKKLKMKFVFGWGTSHSYDWHATMAKRLAQMGFTENDYIFDALLRDEFAKKDIPTLADVRTEFTQKGNPWTFMATYLSTPPPAGATLDDIKEGHLPEFFKLWCPISGLFNTEKKGQEVRDFFRQYGCKIWPYRCSTSMITCSLLEYYRSFPWLVWHFNLDGCAFWTNFSPGSGNRDSFDYRDGGAPDGIVKLDAHRRPIPTKQLEALAEGLEDIAYAFRLKAELEKHPQLTAEERIRLNDLITTRLEEIRKSPNQMTIDAWRLQVGTAIHQLSTAP